MQIYDKYLGPINQAPKAKERQFDYPESLVTRYEYEGDPYPLDSDIIKSCPDRLRRSNRTNIGYW